jgi:cytochrome c6
MKLSIALLAAPALAFAPQAQQRASVKVERRVENHAVKLLRGPCTPSSRRGRGDDVASMAWGARRSIATQVEARKEVAAATLGAAALLAPFAAFAGDIESGATIFAGNCAACHAGGNNVIAAEKTLRKEALDSYLAGGRKESSVVTQVTNGKNAMPAFGGRLSDEEIGDVAAYVIDQANGDKWDE